MSNGAALFDRMSKVARDVAGRTTAEAQIVEAAAYAKARGLRIHSYRPATGCPTHPDGSTVLAIHFAPCEIASSVTPRIERDDRRTGDLFAD